MKKEIKEMFDDSTSYFLGGYFFMKPLFVWALTIGGWISYILFPIETYITYASIVGGLVVLDLITKQYAISVQNGGFRKAFKLGRLSSHSMWNGTRKKLVSYLLVMILIGLSGRFTLISGITILAGNLIYSIMFLREAYSVCENMRDAGYDNLDWFIGIVKRRTDLMTKETEKTSDENKKES